MQWCTAHSVPMVLDACVMAEELRDVVLGEGLSWLLVSANEDELCRLTGELAEQAAVEALLRAGAKRVAVKRGARGSVLMGREGRVEAGAVEVSAVDTTACGDAFSAAVGWALWRGASMQEAVELGNWMGAMTACKPGAVGSIPTRDEVLRATSDPTRQRLIS